MYISFTSEINNTDNEITVTDTLSTLTVPHYYDLIEKVRLEGPTGLIYDGSFGSPDMNHPLDTEFTYALPAPGGVLPVGIYKVKVTGRFTKRANLTYVNIIANSVSIPDGITDIEAGDTIDLGGGANNGTYTVATVTTSAYGVDIGLVEPLSSSTVSGYLEWEHDEELERTYGYNVTIPTASIGLSANCPATRFYTNDNTDYNIVYTDPTTGMTTTLSYTTIARTMVTNFPVGANQVPVDSAQTTSAASNETTTLWTGVWNATLSTDLTYTLPSGLVVSMNVAGQDFYEVTCDTNLCCIKSCLHALYDRYHNALNSNEAEANRLERYITDLSGAYISFRAAVDCGDNDNVVKYYGIMKDIVEATECSCGCDENDASPTQVVPLFPIATNGDAVVIATGDAYIVVTPTQVGATTTYTLTLATDQIETLISTYINANPTLITAIVAANIWGATVSAGTTSYDTALGFTGDIAIGSPNIINVVHNTSASELRVGDPVYGTGIPLGTYIQSIGTGSIVMSANATANTAALPVTIRRVNDGISIQKYKRSISGVDYFHWAILTAVQNSIVIDGTTEAMQLSGDASAPGNYFFYGTNGAGTKGFNDFSVVALALAFGKFYSNNSSTPTDIDSAAEVVGASISNLPAGTYILMSFGKIVGGYTDQITGEIKVNGGSNVVANTIDLVAGTVLNNQIFLMAPYTNAGPGTVTIDNTYQAAGSLRANALRDRTLVAIRVA